MASVKIVRVADSKGLDDFIQFHYDLYRGNPYDVPNLRSDEVNTLSKDRNAAFEFCEADYFLAYKGGKVAGRVAAIINRRANARWGRKCVRFGWIDFVDDREVSAALLWAALPAASAAGAEPVLRVTEGGAPRGGTAEVALWLDGGAAVSGGSMDLTYDSAALDRMRAEMGRLRAQLQFRAVEQILPALAAHSGGVCA